MSLKVIGAGLGRTGTMSLKVALVKLGFEKCNHMDSFLETPELAKLFIEAAHGNAQWDKIFDGYQACTDYPSCYFWQELMEYYPDAKIILTTRDPDSWYKSWQNTILKSLDDPRLNEGPMSWIKEMSVEIVLKRCFSGKIHDPEAAKAIFTAHNEKVRATVPANRLLEYHPSQGWEPLCKFLDVPIPDEPFPESNDPDDWQNTFEEGAERLNTRG